MPGDLEETFDKRNGAHDIRLEKYKYLHEEALSNYKAKSDLERYALIAISAIYAWLFGGGMGGQHYGRVVAAIPVFISAIVCYRLKKYEDWSKSRNMYLQQIEQDYLGVGPFLIDKQKDGDVSDAPEPVNIELRFWNVGWLVGNLGRQGLSGTWTLIFGVSLLATLWMLCGMG